MIYSSAGPQTLAFFRIVVFSIATISALSNPLPLLAFFPEEAIHSMGFLQFLPRSLHLFLLQPWTLQFLFWFSTAVFLCAGLGVSRQAWLYALAALALVLHELIRCSLYSRLPHTRLCLNLLMILCCFFPVADAWSLASGPVGKRASGDLCRIGVRLMLFCITLFYSFIGTTRLLKWSGSGWNEASMAHLVLEGAFLRPGHPDPLCLWILERPWALWLGVCAFFCFSVAEALAPAALFSRRNCLLWASTLLLMHGASSLILKIPFIEQSWLLALFFAEPFLKHRSAS